LTNPVSAPFVITAKVSQAIFGDPTTPVPKRPFNLEINPRTAGSGVTSGGPPVKRSGQPKVDKALTEDERRTRAAVDAVNAQMKRNEEALKGIPIPKGLQQAQVDAQINNSLSAELSADNAILKYLEKKRDGLVKGTKAYLAASKQVEFAQSQRDSVQAEITGNSQAAAAERKRRSDEAIAKDKEAAAAAVANAKASIDLQNARLDARLAAAQGTETKKDDRAVYNAMIKLNDVQIKTLRGEEVGLKRTSQAYKDKEIAVQRLIAANKGLQKSIKGLNDTSDSGFSIADLFKESLSQFQQFGSNVSTNPRTPGQVRGQFGFDIARNIITDPKVQKNPQLVGIDKNTGDAADWMQKLYEFFTGSPAPKSPSAVKNPYSFPDLPGYATAVHARKLKGHR
jgi:hypothetical protein